ncbi:MAG: right-handed parallel beta-helix repeat-containing protein [Verrucomicrobiae bacterium]|nr:right-handed parallel beta-helix repeat-containing protein [Verrucomicrobiae bacterium]
MKPLVGIAFLLAVSVCTAAATVTNTVSAANPDIQHAVDSLPATGGVIILAPGEYPLRRAIRLRSNVTLQGAGPTTTLWKKKHAETKLAAVALARSRTVQVVNPAGFAEGDQVAIRDKDAMGWNVAQAIITRVEGNLLHLDRPLPRTYDPAKSGFVIHIFPAITAENATGIVVRNLTIRDDSVRDLSMFGPLDNPRARWLPVLPFHVAAIHFNNVSDSRVENCHIIGWLSDGISIQGGSVKGPSAGNVTVTRCIVEKCGGNGLHPGGGLHDSAFAQNISRSNGADGLYFCAGVKRVTVSGNQLLGNKANGIGGLGDSGDTLNIVTNNLISGNGQHGIQMSGGTSNTVVDNTVQNNSQSAPGRYSGIWLAATSSSLVKGNRCFDDQKNKTQKCGIEELPGCRDNIVAENHCHGNLQADVLLAANQPAPSPERTPQRARGQRGDGGPRTTAPPTNRTVLVTQPAIHDFTDPTYGSRIRQIVNSAGDEHNLYHYRCVFNADNSRFLAIHTPHGSKDYIVTLYDGDGRFLKPLFTVPEYDWRLTWDRHDPKIFYTWKGSTVYRYDVEANRTTPLRTFENPSIASPSGLSLNEKGDRLLLRMTDKTVRTYRLPALDDERICQIEIPEGGHANWDKLRFTGHKDYFALEIVHKQSSATRVYDGLTGKLLHTLEGISVGHHDFSPDGKLAYVDGFNQRRDMQVRVVNLDGSNNRVVFTAPRDKLRFVRNFHITWPAGVRDWFLLSFFPHTGHLPPSYEPWLDELLQVFVDGRHKVLARTGTTCGANFWAQPQQSASADGSRVVFHTNGTCTVGRIGQKNSGTIDLCILYLE